MTEIAELEHGVPLRMAPLVLGGTLVTHLFGGSAGREGTALQMSASLTDGIGRRLRLDPEVRHGLLIASLAGGFGSVFGVPWAGIVFAMELAPTGWKRRLVALPAAIVASLVGDAVVGWLGVTHTPYPTLDYADAGPVGEAGHLRRGVRAGGPVVRDGHRGDPPPTRRAGGMGAGPPRPGRRRRAGRRLPVGHHRLPRAVDPTPRGGA